MRELLSALIDDTSRQILVLDAAIREADSPQCVRLAHYSKGACANMGAKAAAAVLQKIEKTAAAGDFAECSASLHILSGEIERLREEARSL